VIATDASPAMLALTRDDAHPLPTGLMSVIGHGA
jgi:hypothetical protein